MNTIMPEWMAHLTVWFDDAGTEAAWPAMVRTYAGLADRWHVLTPADWAGLNWACRRVAVEAVLPHAGSAAPSVKNVLALLRRAEAGEVPTQQEFMTARYVASAGGAYTARVVMSYSTAAYAATHAAYAAIAAAVEPTYAGLTPSRTVADSMTLAMLAAIDAAITARESLA